MKRYSRLMLAVMASVIAMQGRADAAPRRRGSELRNFVRAFEADWKARDWKKIAGVAAERVFYANSDEYHDWSEYRGAARERFLRRFLVDGRVDYDGEAKPEGDHWRRTFRERWSGTAVLHTEPRGPRGVRGEDDYDAYLDPVRMAPGLRIYFKREGGRWRLRGLSRSTA
jgi:hypothetical protein